MIIIIVIKMVVIIEWNSNSIKNAKKKKIISVKDFKDTFTMYSVSKPVEIFMRSDTKNVIDTPCNAILNRIQQAIEASNERRSGFTHESVALMYCYCQRIGVRRSEWYIMPPDWIVSKKATLNPKNVNDNESLKWLIIAGLSYNKIKKKE